MSSGVRVEVKNDISGGLVEHGTGQHTLSCRANLTFQKYPFAQSLRRVRVSSPRHPQVCLRVKSGPDFALIHDPIFEATYRKCTRSKPIKLKIALILHNVQ
jgi:hypothetical protein